MAVKEKVIDGITFTVAPFPAIEALRLKSYLIKTLGPSLAEAVDLFKKGADSELTGKSLSGVVEKLSESLDEESFVKLVERMLRLVTAKGKNADGSAIVAMFGNDFENSFNKVFEGRLFSVYPVMLLVLEANYPDFFGRIAGSIGSLTSKINTFAEVKSEAESDSTKSGTLAL